MDAPTPAARASACIDCPLQRRGVLEALVGAAEAGECKLSCLSVEERASVPASWFERYAFGVIRRGVLVRQRGVQGGTRTTVDVAGPGALVPLAKSKERSAYAASRVLLCVYPEAVVRDSTRPEVTLDLLRLAEETLDRVERIADARGRSTASEKIEALHEVLCEHVGPRALEMLLQRDIAAILGLRTETVCRALKARTRRPVTSSAARLV